MRDINVKCVLYVYLCVRIYVVHIHTHICLVRDLYACILHTFLCVKVHLTYHICIYIYIHTILECLFLHVGHVPHVGVTEWVLLELEMMQTVCTQ